MKPEILMGPELRSLERTRTSFGPKTGPGTRPGPYEIRDQVRDQKLDQGLDQDWDQNSQGLPTYLAYATFQLGPDTQRQNYREG